MLTKSELRTREFRYSFTGLPMFWSIQHPNKANVDFSKLRKCLEIISSRTCLQLQLEFISYKKAFFSDQCKEIEENNRMGKTRDLFKKIRDTKGTFHEKMGSIKDRNGKDLTEAEDIKKRWQEYMEELYKKIFTTKIITMV